MVDILEHIEDEDEDEDRRIAKAAKALQWDIIFNAKTDSITGTIQSFIDFLTLVSSQAKQNPALAAFLMSEGSILQSDVFLYTLSDEAAMIDAAMRSQRRHTPNEAGRILFIPSLIRAQIAALHTSASTMHPPTPPEFTPPATPHDSEFSPNINGTPSAAAAASSADLADDTELLVGAASHPLPLDHARHSSVTSGLSAKDIQYKMVNWLLVHLQNRLGDAIYELIHSQNLRDRLFDKAGRNGIKMLAYIEEHIRSNIAGRQAEITHNFAHQQILCPAFNPTAGNSANDFRERILDYSEVATLSPNLCMDASLINTLEDFLDRLAGPLKEFVKFQIDIYKAHRHGASAEPGESDEDMPTDKELLTHTKQDIIRALRARDRAACEEAQLEEWRQSHLKLVNNASTMEVDKLTKQLAVLQAQLLMQQMTPRAQSVAAAPANNKAPEAVSAPNIAISRRSRRSAAPNHVKPARRNTFDVWAQGMRYCVYCNGKHMDKNCGTKPMPSPLRAQTT